MILGLVIAKGDSNRLPRKNTRLFYGRTLVQYALDAAYWSDLDTIALSSDSDDILDILKRDIGATPIMRPHELTLDTTRICDVVLHAVDKLNIKPEAVCLLQPTNPLMDEVTVNEAIVRYKQTGKSVVTGCVMTIRDPLKLIHTTEFQRDGALILTSFDNIKNGELLPLEQEHLLIPKSRYIDINDEEDWKIALVLKKEVFS